MQVKKPLKYLTNRPVLDSSSLLYNSYITSLDHKVTLILHYEILSFILESSSLATLS